MGREQFAPLEARQAVLSERYAFTCTCPRCSAEGLVPQVVQEAVTQAYVTTMQASGSGEGYAWWKVVQKPMAHSNAHRACNAVACW